eukprot:TRINITY_DN77861_c0_g1_i1.p1 TRINITY_DN77861_c0_g1~~TRINITY_DN77861_c0_g1_i1.p1  ORF type:complete len:115 (-),score=1.42 TRINITY_DN77861_c0_g1_i1:61-405(-)
MLWLRLCKKSFLGGASRVERGDVLLLQSALAVGLGVCRSLQRPSKLRVLVQERCGVARPHPPGRFTCGNARQRHVVRGSEEWRTVDETFFFRELAAEIAMVHCKLDPPRCSDSY